MRFVITFVIHCDLFPSSKVLVSKSDSVVLNRTCGFSVFLCKILLDVRVFGPFKAFIVQCNNWMQINSGNVDS